MNSEETTKARSMHDEAIDRFMGKIRKVREDLKNSQEDDLIDLEAQITDYQLIALIAAFREAEMVQVLVNEKQRLRSMVKVLVDYRE